jgi:hypothetical protein
VIVRAPLVVSEMSQLPVATVPVQLSTPSLTSTLPVGVPPAVGATVNSTVTACPLPDGSGSSEVIVVVVSALLTTMLSLQALLPSLVSLLLLFGSTLQAPPARGFANVTALVGVAVKTTSNAPSMPPSVTGPPFATQVRSLLAIEQATFASPVTPLPMLVTLGVP